MTSLQTAERKEEKTPPLLPPPTPNPPVHHISRRFQNIAVRTHEHVQKAKSVASEMGENGGVALVQRLARAKEEIQREVAEQLRQQQQQQLKGPPRR